MIPRREAGCERPIPPPTPVRETFSDTETTQVQIYQGIEEVRAAPATEASLSEPSNSEHDTQGGSTTQVSSLVVTKAEAGEISDDKVNAGPSDKSSQKITTENENLMTSSTAPAAIHSDTAIEE